MLAAAAFKDVMLDPKTAFSEEVTESGAQRALNTKLPLWEYYELPENRYRGDRFNLVMSGANNMHPEAILAGELSFARRHSRYSESPRLQLE